MAICALTATYSFKPQNQLIIHCDSKDYIGFTLRNVLARLFSASASLEDSTKPLLLSFQNSASVFKIITEQMVCAATSLHNSSLTTNWIHALIHHETNSLRNVKLCTKQTSQKQ